MSLKCLNCHNVCAASDVVCLFCGYKVTDTSVAAKKGSATAINMKFAVIFMIIGSAIYNSMIAPKWFPSKGGINYEQIMWAAIVGAVCAVLGGIVGSLTTDRD